MNSEKIACRVALVGAECEESLPLRYLQASLQAAGHGVELLACNRESDLDSAARNLARIVDMAAAGADPAAGTIEAFRRDLATDTGRREREASEILAAIRRTAWNQSHTDGAAPARIGLAASILLAAGTSALGQHMEEMVVVPLDQPATPPAAAPVEKPSANASATNAPAARPGRPPDGDFNRVRPFLHHLARVIAPHVTEPRDMDLELWLDANGKISFAALYRGGHGKDADHGGLSKEAETRAKELLGELGAGAFPARENATRQLKELGTPVLPLVKAWKARHSDPEVTQRCEQIIAALDILAPVRNYDEMIRQLKTVKLTLGEEDYNKRYIGAIPASTLGAWKRWGIGRGEHIFEMVPVPGDD